MPTHYLIDFPYRAFILFSLAMLYSPGPNNTMLATSGANTGFIKTLPHILGVTLGFSLMVFFLGAGVGTLMKRFTWLEPTLNIGSALFIVWFCWKLVAFNPKDPRAEADEKPNTFRPLHFWQAVLFQWINGKAWLMGMVTIGQYLRPERFLSDLVIVSLLFAVLGSGSATLWTLSGTFIGRLLSNPTHLRMFNFISACMLIASVVAAYLLR